MRNISGSRKERTALAAIVVAGLLAASAASAQHASGSQVGGSWRVKDSRLQLRLDPDRLAVLERGAVVQSIPLNGITALALDATADRPVPGAMVRWADENFKAATASGEAGVLFILTGAAGAAVMTPFLGLKLSKHRVHILWEENGAQQVAAYRMREKDARSLLAALSQATGRPWREFERERLKVKKQQKELEMELKKRVK